MIFRNITIKAVFIHIRMIMFYTQQGISMCFTVAFWGQQGFMQIENKPYGISTISLSVAILCLVWKYFLWHH